MEILALRGKAKFLEQALADSKDLSQKSPNTFGSRSYVRDEFDSNRIDANVNMIIAKINAENRDLKLKEAELVT